MTGKMKRCPFCGGEPSLSFNNLLRITFVRCYRCGVNASFITHEKKADTIRCWNRRENDKRTLQ